MNNAVASVLIVVCCVLAGYLCGRYVKSFALRKKMFFADICKYVAEFGNNVNGRQIEMHDFNENFALRCSDVFAQYLCYDKLPTFSADDKNAVNDFFVGLNGATSIDLASHLDYYGKVFAERLAVAQSEADKSAVYPKLGLLLGLMIAILLI